MQSAETVLGVLRERGRRGLPCEELYRQLFNPQLYLLAYGRIYANHGAMTPGVTTETADGMSQRKIDRTIEAMRHERYRFRPVRRVHIPKKNGKTRPLGLPTWSDKLVGEVVRLLLEAYYEPMFSGRSHGFRPRRGCHTALREVAHTWTGAAWFIEGDIADCFGSLDHQVLLAILGEKVHDQRFLRLVRNMLTAGYLEDWKWGATLSGAPQGGVASPLLANIYLSVLDRHFSRIWNTEMSPGWQRQARRRKGLPNYRLVRYADDFVVLVHGTKSEAETLKAEIGELLARRLKMTLSVEKTHVTHIDDGFVFLGFHIQRRPWCDGRRVVLTIPSKQALASVMHKIKKLTGRSTTSLSLEQVLRSVNPVLRGWAAYFRYGVSKRTFSYLGWYAWWRLLLWIRYKHPRLTWKQLRRRYYGADRITEGGIVLYNPAKMRVQRYTFRGAQISTPYNIDEVDPDGARFRRTNHDDVAFVGQVSEYLA
jgi:RNA-directed DNA polymerase